MAATSNPANNSAWTEPDLPMSRGILGAGWLPETLCVLAILPTFGMLAGVISITQAVSVLAFAGALGVAALALGERA
jgi:hypothetical protein